MTTSYNAQDMAVQLEDMQASVTALQESTLPVLAHIRDSAAALESIVHLLNKAYAPKDINSTALISTTPVMLDKQGRHYLYIFSPVAVTGIVVNIMGITAYSLSLNAGWNAVDFPDGTLLTGASGTTQQVIIKATNHYQGIAV